MIAIHPSKREMMTMARPVHTSRPARKRALRRWSIVALLALFLGAALSGCGGAKRTGSEKILDFQEQEDAERLGEQAQAASPTPSPTETKAAVSQNTQSPPPASETFFDVTLVAASPYFEPGNELVMPRSMTLRVTNKDNTAERPTRSFTDEGGSFDSGPLKLGETWTHKFAGPGNFRIVDSKAPFIFATLEVR